MEKEEAVRLLLEEMERCQRAPELNGCEMKPEWQRTMDVCRVAVEALREQEQRRWIPVTERLPDKEFWDPDRPDEDEDLEVLVMIKGAKMATTLFYNAEGEFYSMDEYGYNFYVVTHWMPLPEPPKEE